jgi:hypothetical protein
MTFAEGIVSRYGVVLTVGSLLAVIAGGGKAHAQGTPHVADLLPKSRSSPLLAAPEQAKVDEFTGSAGYQYPIVVPPGTGGATPSLALSYSSLTRATEYGWGWSLNLSKIERSTRFGPPTYTSSDRFELDGEPWRRGRHSLRRSKSPGTLMNARVPFVN